MGALMKALIKKRLQESYNLGDWKDVVIAKLHIPSHQILIIGKNSKLTIKQELKIDAGGKILPSNIEEQMIIMTYIGDIVTIEASALE